MRLNWHVKAARVAAANPHWTWSQVCAEVARRKKPVRVVPKTVAASEKNLWYLKD